MDIEAVGQHGIEGEVVVEIALRLGPAAVLKGGARGWICVKTGEIKTHDYMDITRSAPSRFTLRLSPVRDGYLLRLASLAARV